jgi:hypothetical protein
LPTGLSINATTCAISGTPTVVTIAGEYSITASNGVGNAATVDISIEILNIVPNIAYAGAPYSFTQNVAGATTGVPTNTGGGITSCGVSPALPAGLSISSTTCAITGTPTAATADATYTVTPSNAMGSGTARNINIAVYAPVTVTSVTNNDYGVCGPTGSVTITGTGFLPGATVTWASYACTGVVVNSSTSITCNVTTVGGLNRNVTVTNSNGSTGTRVNALVAVCPI